MKLLLTTTEAAAHFGVTKRFALDHFPRVAAFRNPLRYRVEDIEAYLAQVKLPNAEEKKSTPAETYRNTARPGLAVHVPRRRGPSPVNHDWTVAGARRKAGLPAVVGRTGETEARPGSYADRVH